MPYNEDDIRAALHALAGQAPDTRTVLTRLHEQLDPADRSGHRQPGRRPRFTWRLLIPLAAAAAVLAVILISVAIRAAQQPRPVTPRPSPVLSLAPPYYMYLPYPSCEANGHACPPAELVAVVRSTKTGATIGTVLPPKSTYFTWLVGASDDRTFVLFVAPQHWTPPRSCAQSRVNPDCVPPDKPYVARFDPAARTITLHALPIRAIRLGSSNGLPALSANGTELAVDSGGTGRPAVTQIRVYSLATGAVREWHGAGTGETMAWGPDGQLAIYGLGTGITMLNTNTAGGSVPGASHVAVSYQQPGHYVLRHDFALSGDGQTIVVQAMRTPAGNRNPDGQIRWYSVTTGREIRAYTPPANTGNESWQVLWSNSSGSVTVLRRTSSDKTDRSDTFGVLNGTKFVPIPLGAAQADIFFNNPIAF